MLGLEPGSLFAGRYEIVRNLGAGGMGAVYLACDPTDREFLVALKILYPGALESPQARERFRNEITASYKINHPNVVKAYEYFDAEDMQAYAMEFVDGGDLMDRILEGPMSPDEAIDIMKQIASALSCIHAAGILHRDLKPENILLTKRGEVKISDFGVARLRSDQALTQAGSMVGTPKYLAPEYVETGECDQRGDIFALGVIAYELLSGTSPFGKNFKSEQVLERLTFQVPPLETVSPNCPPELAQIVEKAMSMRLSKRYQSADALIQDLEALKSAPPPVEGIPLSHREVISREEYYEPPPAQDPVPMIESPELVASEYVGLSAGPSKFDALLNFAHDRFQPLAKVFAGLAIVILAIGIAAEMRWLQRSVVIALPDGQYSGMVIGALGENSRYPIAVLRRGQNTWILLGKPSCPMSPIDPNGGFSCGALTFTFTVSSTAGTKAVGTIKENSWGTVGTWNIERVDGRKPT